MYTQYEINKKNVQGVKMMLIEQDAGCISPIDPRNQPFINEIKSLGSGKVIITEPLVIYAILQKYGILNRNGRIYPREILVKQNELYQKAIRERSAVGECVPHGTEIFTINGWRPIEDVKIGDKIFSLNLETNSIENESIESTIKKNYKDDLVHLYNSGSLDMRLTKNHKMILWDRYNKPYEMTAIEVYEAIKNKDSKISHSKIRYSGFWKGTDEEYFILPNTDLKIKTELWAAFLGFFISEGHTAGSRGGKVTNRVTITQSKAKQKELLVELLNQLPFEYTISDNRQFNIYNQELHNHLSVLGNSEEKHIPEYAKNWSPVLLNTLLTWLLLGDGRNRHNKKGELLREYYTTSPKLSEDVFEIMLKLGSGASISNRQQKDRYITDSHFIDGEEEVDGSLILVRKMIKSKRLIKAENSKLLYIVSEKTTASVSLDARFTKVQLEPYNDDVYCVSVPNKTWMMRYNNQVAWTHNCDHPESSIISIDRISHNIIETWWEGHTLMGKVEILMSPGFINSGIVSTKGDEIANLLRNGIKIGVSSRGVGSLAEGKNGEQIVQNDYEIICWDAVTAPSTPDGWFYKSVEEARPFVEGITKNNSVIKETLSNRLDKFLLD